GPRPRYTARSPGRACDTPVTDRSDEFANDATAADRMLLYAFCAFASRIISETNMAHHGCPFIPNARVNWFGFPLTPRYLAAVSATFFPLPPSRPPIVDLNQPVNRLIIARGTPIIALAHRPLVNSPCIVSISGSRTFFAADLSASPSKMSPRLAPKSAMRPQIPPSANRCTGPGETPPDANPSARRPPAVPPRPGGARATRRDAPAPARARASAAAR